MEKIIVYPSDKSEDADYKELELANDASYNQVQKEDIVALIESNFLPSVIRIWKC